MLLLVTIPFAFVFLWYDVVGLKPEDKLTTSCYGFPSSDFSFQNNIKNTYNETPHLILNTDDEAIDFTLLSYEVDLNYLMILTVFYQLTRDS